MAQATNRAFADERRTAIMEMLEHNASVQVAEIAQTFGVSSVTARADLDALERGMLEAINASRVGAQGFTGDTTALAVHIEAFPTHICALPVAVNIQCNAVRCASLTL